MKAVTEFPGFVLSKAIEAKAALVAEGKTPEEIQTSLGGTYKLEGEKLTCLLNAIELATPNVKNLKRVIVMRAAENETAPTNMKKIEELYYTAEILNLSAPKPYQKPEKGGRGGRGGGKGGGKSGPKESPWGLSPEEKAAKNAKKAPAGTPPAKS